MRKIIFCLIVLISITTYSEIEKATERSVISYKIKKGDTIEKISKEYNITNFEIEKLNPNIKNLDKIRIGENILVLDNTSVAEKIKKMEEKSIEISNKINSSKLKFETTDKNIAEVERNLENLEKIIIRKLESNTNENKTISNTAANGLKVEIQENFLNLLVLLIMGWSMLMLAAYKSLKSNGKSKETLVDNSEKIMIKLEKYENQVKELLEAKETKFSQEGSVNNINILTKNQELIEIRKQLIGIDKYLDEKGNLIKRYENGYDMKIKDQFIKEIMDTIDYLIKQNKSENNGLVNDTIEDLELLLDNNGIFKVNLKSGDSYKGKEGIAVIKKIENTEENDKDYIIKDIVKAGYYIKLVDDKKKIIRPSRVIIYRCIGGEEI